MGWRLALGGMVLVLGAACGEPAPAPPTTAPATAAPVSKPVSPVPSPVGSPSPTGNPSPAAAPIPTPATRMTVRFGGLGNAPDRALFVARDLGYFDEQNLDVQVAVFQSAAEMIPLMATARLDAGNGGSSPAFFNAFSSGIPLKIVSDVTVSKRPDPNVHSSEQIMVGKQLYEQGVSTLADLKGHKIAINAPGSLNQEQLEQCLATVGLTTGDVQLEIVGFNEMLAAVTSGAVDAAVALEPFITLGERQGAWRSVFDVADALEGQTAEWLIYSDQFITSNPEAGRRLIVAYTRAMRWIEDAETSGLHRDQEIAIMTRNTAVKDPTLYAQLGRSYGETDSRVNLDQLARDQQYYLRTGGQSRLIDAAQLVDTSFGDYARQVLGPNR